MNTIRADDCQSSVSPRTQTIRGKPIDADVSPFRRCRAALRLQNLRTMDTEDDVRYRFAKPQPKLR
jgi:hypothetical protein